MIKYSGIRIIILIFCIISIQYLGLSSLFSQVHYEPSADYDVQCRMQDKVELSAIHGERSQKSKTELADNSMRELSVIEIKNFTTGCYSIEKTNELIQFQRFPQEVRDILKPNPTWYIRSESTSGIKISFHSNTSKIYFSGKVFANTPQTESFVVLCNDSLIAIFPGKTEKEEFEQMVLLPGTKAKIIEIYFPAYSKGIMHYRRQLRSIARDYSNIRIFHYNELIPDMPDLFVDGLHPTPKGHEVYGKNLTKLLKKNFPKLKTTNKKYES